MSKLGDLIRGGIETTGRDVSIFRGVLTLKGRLKKPGTTEVRVLMQDTAGKVLYATGTTVPSDSETGYAKGCLFSDTDVGAGTTGLYVNVGTTTACNFDAVVDA